MSSRGGGIQFTAHVVVLEDEVALRRSAAAIIVHLAAQARVRYRLENLRAYIDANLFGTINLL